MNIAIVVVLTLSLFFIYATFISLVRWEYWWVRIFDYPRLQIGVLLILALIAGFIIYDFKELWHYIITGLLLGSIFYQARKVYRYTIFAKKQVLTYKGGESEDSFSLIVSNVWQPNRNFEKLLSLVKKMRPDLLLILEANKWWEEQLKVIEQEYPYKIGRAHV